MTAYDDGTFKGCSIEWLEDELDGAVEGRATNTSGRTVAIEHTLIQPFEDEKSDSHRFLRAFRRIEQDPSLVMPQYQIDLTFPVGALPTGYDWDVVGEEVRTWLATNRGDFVVGTSNYACTVGAASGKEPFELSFTLTVEDMEGKLPGCWRIGRTGVPRTLDAVVDKALRTKLPKLVNTPADQHILLLELDQPISGPQAIYDTIAKKARQYPDIRRVEIWFVDTVARYTEDYVTFELRDSDGFAQSISFEGDKAPRCRDDRK
ncbi:MAG: hypothetical protein O2968_04315 [Acidobacteria bacterium]|nr:hypothetical protein [Acidobacteriota bacterium]